MRRARTDRACGRTRATIAPLRPRGAGRENYHATILTARFRVAVKRILKKHGYPPGLQDAAIKTVVEQAEALAAQVW